ncbi:MAG: type II and III secretion system protein family protein [Rhodospirillaceae bacterium]|nr:type II and III secretion system protein family protein [Rhodospirillales bacterium]
MAVRTRLLALFLVMAGPALAQSAAPEPPLPLAAPRVKVISMSMTNPAMTAKAAQITGEPARFALNKTHEIILPGPVRDVVVGSADVVDVVVRTPTQVYLVGKGVGQTDVTFFDMAGKVMRRVAVDVHLDADALREVLSEVMPEEKNVRVSGVGDSLYLSGTVRNDGTAGQIRALARRFVKDEVNVVNLLKISAEQQVLMQVKVAEMQKSVLKELGVELRGEVGSTGNVRAIFNPNSAVGLTQTPFGSLTVSGIGALVGQFNALETQGLVRTLVEPNMTAVSGETANLLAGGEFPIPVAAQNGQITIEFKQFGVLLNFTPVVLDPGRISLKLQSEVSAVSSEHVVRVNLANREIIIPGLTVRRASSTVEMASGGSIMIAGLLQNDITSNLSGLPGIMDIPILGTLFKSSSFQRKETELVVIVSAFVVQPLEKPRLSMPTDGFAPSSDWDRILLNRLQENYTTSKAPAPVPVQLQGPIGYIVQ